MCVVVAVMQDILFCKHHSDSVEGTVCLCLTEKKKKKKTTIFIKRCALITVKTCIEIPAHQLKKMVDPPY